MPVFTTGQSNEPTSSLAHGWHGSVLYGIRTEPIPEYYTSSREKDTHQWQWYCAIWQTLDEMFAGKDPELRALSTTRTFSGERKSVNGEPLSASKAFRWTCSLLGRVPSPSEAVSLDDKLPLFVLVNVIRRPDSQFIKTPELLAWPANSAEWPRPEKMPTCIAVHIANLPVPIVEPPRPQIARAPSAATPPPPAPAPQPAAAPRPVAQRTAPAGWPQPAAVARDAQAPDEDDIPF